MGFCVASLHGFEQGTLHLGRGTVDFIGENEVGKDGSLVYHELLVLLAVYHRSDYVGGQEVGSKLDAVELGIHQFGQGTDGQRLGQTGYTFQQHVAITEEADEEGFYQMFLPHDDLVHTCHQICHESTLPFNLFV